MPPKTAILAGGGGLPRQLVDACRRAGREVFVVTFEGQGGGTDWGDVPNACVPLGRAGATIRLLHRHGCEEVVLAGRLRRPDLRSLKLDFRAMRMLPRMLRAGGDDALLRVVMDELESEGFRVIGVDTLAPSLQVGEGPLGSVAPGARHRADIDTGRSVLRALGPFDIGQAVVVQDGRVLGVEGPEGTDALIERCAGLERGAGGVLVKMRKSVQDARADLPTIGVETVRRCVAARLAGIAVEAGGTLVMDLDALRQTADAAGLFVVGIAGEAE